ncbi:MAG: glycogen debranching protein GlgX [Desulfobulbaceae bacterium]
MQIHINDNYYQVKVKDTLRTGPGLPQPKGATPTPGGINFALFSRHAESVVLVLAWNGRSGLESREELLLDPRINRTGDVWHIMVEGLPPGFRYGYRVAGPHDPRGEGHWYDPSLVLLDPYARMIAPSGWGEDRPCLGRDPCCMLPDFFYDWEGDRPLCTPLPDTVIYEMHVRGYTAHSSSGVEHPGTFAGIIDKIPYLRELGVTAVELMPITEFNENEVVFRNPFTGERLKNFWGYSPLSFFAPKGGYGRKEKDPVTEFRDMVKALHRAGIEVILDIVFNHTAEGGLDGPTTSFRGIDNSIYYLLDPETREYLNYSGCGNTINCNHPIVRNLIMNVLRWWVVEMHVDGFRFDLASILGRDQQGKVLSNPPVVEQIAEDPVLASSKIIAEAWDAAGLYQVGSFSTHQRWAEWNGRFRDDVRAFMCGYPGKVPALATRIAGSADLYSRDGRRPCNSINFITSHDGFTLHDLVSYNEKHNLANGEDNRDGENNNISWNSGVEGETADHSILALRSRRMRTMLVILFISQGVPMLTAGDEFGRTQQGNNNAWCQDNEIGWVDWTLLEQNRTLFEFCRKLIALRKAHPVFRRDDFFVPAHPESDPPHLHEIIWQGVSPDTPIWTDEALTLAFTLNGSVLEQEDDDFFVMLNGDRVQPARFTVPEPPGPHRLRTWRAIIDTGRQAPDDFVEPADAKRVRPGARIKVAPMGCVVLQSENRQKRRA